MRADFSLQRWRNIVSLFHNKHDFFSTIESYLMLRARVLSLDQIDFALKPGDRSWNYADYILLNRDPVRQIKQWEDGAVSQRAGDRANRDAVFCLHKQLLNYCLEEADFPLWPTLPLIAAHIATMPTAQMFEDKLDRYFRKLNERIDQELSDGGSTAAMLEICFVAGRMLPLENPHGRKLREASLNIFQDLFHYAEDQGVNTFVNCAKTAHSFVSGNALLGAHFAATNQYLLSLDSGTATGKTMRSEQFYQSVMFAGTLGLWIDAQNKQLQDFIHEAFAYGMAGLARSDPTRLRSVINGFVEPINQYPHVVNGNFVSLLRRETVKRGILMRVTSNLPPNSEQQAWEKMLQRWHPTSPVQSYRLS